MRWDVSFSQDLTAEIRQGLTDPSLGLTLAKKMRGNGKWGEREMLRSHKFSRLVGDEHVHMVINILTTGKYFIDQHYLLAPT
jgi:hypothetical protein